MNLENELSSTRAILSQIANDIMPASMEWAEAKGIYEQQHSLAFQAAEGTVDARKAKALELSITGYKRLLKAEARLNALKITANIYQANLSAIQSESRIASIEDSLSRAPEPRTSQQPAW